MITDIDGRDQRNELSMSWSETALEWMQRSEMLEADAAVPKDPKSAAWAFLRARESYGTGLSFIDSVIKNNAEHLSVVELRGGNGVGKTWTLVTLAARFVVATRATKFQSITSNDLPQVFFMDSLQSVKIQHIKSAVRRELLRDLGDDTAIQSEYLELEICSALRRIRIIFGEGATTWVPTLESLRHELAGKPFPTLVAWDGFLSDVHDVTGTLEVIRQVNRLTKETTVQIITTTASGRFYAGWDKCVDHRIRLERIEAVDADKHEFMATTSQPLAQLAYTITGGGILT